MIAFKKPILTPTSSQTNMTTQSTKANTNGILGKRSLEQAGLASSSEPKTCNCRKSKCLKLYCECFAGGNICGVTCSCVGCNNLQGFENIQINARQNILSRNPTAFNKKLEENQIVCI